MNHEPANPRHCQPPANGTRLRDFFWFLALAGVVLFLAEQVTGLFFEGSLPAPARAVTYAAAVLAAGCVGMVLTAAFGRCFRGPPPARATVLLPATYAVVMVGLLVVLVLLGDREPPPPPDLFGGALAAFVLIMAALVADDLNPLRRRAARAMVMAAWLGWCLLGLDCRALPEPWRLGIMIGGIGLMPAAAWELSNPRRRGARRRRALLLLALAAVWALDAAGESALASRPGTNATTSHPGRGPNLLLLISDRALSARDLTFPLRLKDPSLTEDAAGLARALAPHGYQCGAVWAAQPPADPPAGFTYFNRRGNPLAVSGPARFALHHELLRHLPPGAPEILSEPYFLPRQAAARAMTYLDSIDPARPWLLLLRFEDAGPGPKPGREAGGAEEVLAQLRRRGLLESALVVLIQGGPGPSAAPGNDGRVSIQVRFPEGLPPGGSPPPGGSAPPGGSPPIEGARTLADFILLTAGLEAPPGPESPGLSPTED